MTFHSRCLSCNAGAAATPQPAQAIRDVQLPDGSMEEAYELDIPLQVVSLRGTIPADASQDFRKALSRHARFKLSQRGQLKDIYNELSNVR